MTKALKALKALPMPLLSPTGVRLSRMLLLIFLLPTTVSAQTLYVDEQFGFERTTGVVFTTKPAGDPVADMDLRLELYEPTGTGVPTPRPALILIHGGGFVGGTRFNARLVELCERMARRGYTCVSIDYRLEGDAPVVGAPFLPIQASVEAAGGTPQRAAAIAAAGEDSWAAYEWLVSNAGSLGIDMARIGVGGSSAGAFTSLIDAYVLDEIGVAPANAYRAVFEMWGGLGASVALIDATDAPLLITHGSLDTTVPVSEAYALEAQAISVGLPHEAHVVTGAGHGYDIFTVEVVPGDTMFDRFVAFFYTHVAQASAPPTVPSMSIAHQHLLLAALLIGGTYAIARMIRTRGNAHGKG